MVAGLKKHCINSLGHFCGFCHNKAFWKIMITFDDSNIEMNFYTCGPHYNKMENKIFHRYPEANLVREKIELVDFVKLEASKENARKFRKLYNKGKITEKGIFTEGELGIG